MLPAGISCLVFQVVSGLLFIRFLAGTSMYWYVTNEIAKVKIRKAIQITQPVSISGFGGGPLTGLLGSIGLK